MKSPEPSSPKSAGDRIAKVMARAGLCSRRDAEVWIAEGRVAVNGRVLDTPATIVGPTDEITVDGQPMPQREPTRLWLYHKPRGLVTTARDPEGRRTVFEALPKEIPRVVTIGRLDINTEGLLLLTNDGGLARTLELPATGWLRRYRVRVHGDVDEKRLAVLKDGLALDGILYGPVEAALERTQGSNAWLTVGLREGKNREIKKIMEHLGLAVTRLIRVSFGPFQLGDLAEGTVREIPRKMLRDQLGERLAREAGAEFPAAPTTAERKAAREDVEIEEGAPARATLKMAGGKVRPARAPRPHRAGEGAPGQAPKSGGLVKSGLAKTPRPHRAGGGAPGKPQRAHRAEESGPGQPQRTRSSMKKPGGTARPPGARGPGRGDADRRR